MLGTLIRFEEYHEWDSEILTRLWRLIACHWVQVLLSNYQIARFWDTIALTDEEHRAVEAFNPDPAIPM